MSFVNQKKTPLIHSSIMITFRAYLDFVDIFSCPVFIYIKCYYTRQILNWYAYTNGYNNNLGKNKANCKWYENTNRFFWRPYFVISVWLTLILTKNVILSFDVKLSIWAIMGTITFNRNQDYIISHTTPW